MNVHENEQRIRRSSPARDDFSSSDDTQYIVAPALARAPAPLCVDAQTRRLAAELGDGCLSSGVNLRRFRFSIMVLSVKPRVSIKSGQAQ